MKQDQYSHVTIRAMINAIVGAGTNNVVLTQTSDEILQVKSRIN